jgi:predicted ribosome quality control (RQC) complex YloA/Tae2 family protein
LELKGFQIQKVFQPTFEILILRVYKAGITKELLFSIASDSCRFHETFREIPKSDKPLRFGEFCKSRLANSWIEDVVQLGGDRILLFKLRHGDEHYKLYARLWGGAANIIVTNNDSLILDAMRRLPKRGECSGGFYKPESANAADNSGRVKEFVVRDYDKTKSFNEAIDTFYAEEGGAASLPALRDEAARLFEAKITRIEAALEKLLEKQGEAGGASPTGGAPAGGAPTGAEKLKEEADAIMAGLGETGAKESVIAAQKLYARYQKAKRVLQKIEGEIEEERVLLADTKTKLAALLLLPEPLLLQKELRKQKAKTGGKDTEKRPGLCFSSNGRMILVGRSAKENDDLLRHYVRGSDVWFHTRDVSGGYVFVKALRGKSVPLETMLDAGNLAVFYSKARNSGKADLFYTEVKYLRRAKNAPKGLVIPTQEKNLSITLDEKRLKRLEGCK